MCARRCRIGSANAAVLPVPVCARPSRSRPASTWGIARAWIGVGVSYPCAATAWATRGLNPSSRNRPRDDVARPPLLELLLESLVDLVVERRLRRLRLRLEIVRALLGKLGDFLLGFGALLDALPRLQLHLVVRHALEIGRQLRLVETVEIEGAFGDTGDDVLGIARTAAFRRVVRGAVGRGRLRRSGVRGHLRLVAGAYAGIAVDDGGRVDLARELGELLVVRRRDLLHAAVLLDRRVLAVAECGDLLPALRSLRVVAAADRVDR